MKVNGKAYRTIWPDDKDRSIIHIIDQRYLPHEFVVENLRTVDDFVEAIRGMHLRGAGLIGAAAGFAMYCAALSSRAPNMDAHLRAAAAQLTAARPTARNLAWAVERQLESLSGATGTEAKIEKAFEVACRIADEDAEACRMIGRHGLSIIADISRTKGGEPVNILTHCNAGWLAFVDYGSATAPIYEARQEGIPVHVWVDETRPWLQGAKLTAWELANEEVPHTLIADNAGGHLMQHGMVDLVIVGSDRTTRTGDVANKIGTYLKALAARDCNVPFYTALPSSTFDWHLRDGVGGIPIEQRGGDEVKYVAGINRHGDPESVLIAPPDCRAVNYAFDVTPARLVTGLITERGVVRAREDELLALFPEYKIRK